MPVASERVGPRGGKIRGLAHAHQSAHHDQFLKAPRMSGKPRQQRPDEQAPDDQTTAIEPVREEARERTEQAIDPQEHRGEQAKLRIRHRDRRRQ
jgi:hypothetical protein